MSICNQANSPLRSFTNFPETCCIMVTSTKLLQVCANKALNMFQRLFFQTGLQCNLTSHVTCIITPIKTHGSVSCGSRKRGTHKWSEYEGGATFQILTRSLKPLPRYESAKFRKSLFAFFSSSSFRTLCKNRHNLCVHAYYLFIYLFIITEQTV